MPAFGGILFYCDYFGKYGGRFVPETLIPALDELEQACSHPKSVEDYKKGKENAIMFLVGSVMRETKGRANPEVVKKMLKEDLSKKLLN